MCDGISLTNKNIFYFPGFQCAPFPSMNDLQFSNHLWQELVSSFSSEDDSPGGTFYFYRAYYDDRERGNSGGNNIRILGMANRSV